MPHCGYKVFLGGVQVGHLAVGAKDGVDVHMVSEHHHIRHDGQQHPAALLGLFVRQRQLCEALGDLGVGLVRAEILEELYCAKPAPEE